MKKNNAVGRNPQHHSRKACISSIISILTITSQYWRYKRLIKAINCGELTTSLEILEESGFTEDLALFILGEIVACGVCDE